MTVDTVAQVDTADPPPDDTPTIAAPGTDLAVVTAAPLAVPAPAERRPLFHYNPDTGETTIPTMIEGATLTFYSGQTTLNQAQLVLLGPLGIEANWNPQHVMVFLMTCLTRGFDPWGREAYLLRYRDSTSADGWRYINHTGIPGFRSGSERTGLYLGRDQPLYSGDDGVWREVWPYRDVAPYAAKVIVKRADRDPTGYVALYDEYAPHKEIWKDGKRTGQFEITAGWRPAAQGGKPFLMLGKCAEAGAHRAGFPQVHSGFYVEEEFHRLRAAEERPTVSDKLRQAHAAAQAAAGEPEDGDQPARETITVTVPPADGFDPADLDTVPEQTSPDPEAIRDLLLAELNAQGAVLGKDVRRRWELRHGRPFDTATPTEVQAHVHKIRPYVITALATADRQQELSVYRQAAAFGTLAELFGRDPSTPPPPGQPEAVTVDSGTADPWEPRDGEEDTR